MDLAAIESQRQALETQVQKLRDSLKHWQTLDLEYEGLKEELQALDNPSEQDLDNLSTTYDGTLVDTKEIRDMTGLNNNQPRSSQQIVGVIDRRLEYVTKNIETISRQFYAAENKLEEFAFASSAASGANPRFDDEPDLPLIEIHEELDENGDVISSELRRPIDETSKIIESIRKAASDQTIGDDLDGQDDNESGQHNGYRRPPIRKKSVSFSADTKAAPEPARSESQEGRKSVSFAPKVAVAPAADPPDTRRYRKAKDLRASFKPGEKVYELNEDEETVSQHVVLPVDESPEDAQLRREMLEYHMNEVGSVVAQMDLDEADDHSDLTGSEYYEEGDTPYTSETDEEDEDEHGRSRRREISDAYHEQMKALQERLIGNVGPQPQNEDLASLDVNPQDIHRLVIRGNRNSISSASGSDVDKKTSKKRVSFAEAVDVAEAEPLPNKLQKVEAGSSAVLADTLLERDTSQSAVAGPALDDELTSRRELANEYYRRRNDMIKQQGGFKADEEEEELGQLMEERDGKLKKVSRFKAARLKS
ncbi:hypothetical protein AMS68_007335 [Peltaster fructicola]|uniref:DUF3835 domain-containing protein n=1 Tax=Peltaster fructicola TaxID=286661 RepID=A0A6H0Y4Q0_9PEZI|nr:hypothetical protein AMS68_007335 [Peltaster fructicola]